MLAIRWSIALLLWGGSSALAHEPHDPSFWVAVGPGEDPSWVVTTFPLHVRNSIYVVRTADEHDLEARWALGDDEGLLTGAMLSDQRLVVGTHGEGLWVSDDVGDSFAVHADIPSDAAVMKVVPSPDVLLDGVAVAIGHRELDDGSILGLVWRTQDGGETWQQSASLDDVLFWDLSLSPLFGMDGRAFAITYDGVVYRSRNAGVDWEELGSVGAVPFEVAAGSGDRVWVGTENSGLLRSRDDGESFEFAGYDERPVVTLAEFAADLVMFAYADQAVYVSTDGGDSFVRSPEGIEEPSPGQPSDNIHYFEFFGAGDGSIWLSSWEGIIKSEDNGRSWRHVETLPPEAMRDVAMTLDAAGNPAALAVSIGGGGASMIDPKAGTVVPMGLSHPEPFYKGTATTADFGRDRISLFYTLAWLVKSWDADANWIHAAEDSLFDLWDLALPPDYSTHPVIFGAGNVEEGGGWCVSPDDGASWDCHVPQTASNFCSALHVSSGFDSDGLAWVACGDVGEVQVSSDFGTSWSHLGDVGAGVWGLAGTPDGDHLYIATHNGLFRSVDGGQPELLAFEGESVWDVEVSPDWASQPEAFVLVAGNGWYRSTDAGESWELLDAPSEEPMVTVAVSPNYGNDRTVAVAGFDGVFLSTDGGDSWDSIHAYELHSYASPRWTIDRFWAREEHDDAINGNRLVSDEEGAVATLKFRGVGLDLLCSTGESGGELGLLLDDEDHGSVDLAGDEATGVTVWSVRDLEDDWHVLELSVLSGQGMVEGAHVLRLDFDITEFPPATENGDTGDTDDGPGGKRCGCAASSAARLAWLPWLALPALLAARRRRD